MWHEYAKHACSSKLRFYSFDLIFLGSIFHYAVISNMILYSSLLDLLYGFRLKVCAGSLLFSKIASCWLAGNYGFKKSKFTCKNKIRSCCLYFRLYLCGFNIFQNLADCLSSFLSLLPSIALHLLILLVLCQCSDVSSLDSCIR